MMKYISRRRRRRRLAYPRMTVLADRSPRSLSIEPLEARLPLSGTPADDVAVAFAHSDPSPQANIDGEEVPDLVAFAQALTDADVKFFGAAWCPACTAQKRLFEDGQNYLPFIEVTNPDRTPNATGISENINTYPTWERADGQRLTGQQTLEALSDFTGVAIPMSADVFLAPIDDQTVLSGSPLHIALDGYDPNGGPITYTVEVSGATVQFEATLIEGNRTLRLNVAGYGTMDFMLFEQRVPGVTNEIIAIAQDGTYDNTIFHRIINGFVIQGGDPTGTGFGDPSLGTFDDQFHPELQHNRTGMLSMAKSQDDTNSSQFFITEGGDRQKRSLDGNHSVFGVITEGESNREAISNVPTTPNNPNDPIPDNKPLTDVVLESAEIFFDQENGVLMLKAPEGVSGTATVTVTATDEDGNSTQRSFDATITPDTLNTAPWLEDIPPVQTVAGTPAQFTLGSVDVEGDPVFFAAANIDPNVDYDFTIDDSTGDVTVTPPDGFLGTLEFRVGVRAVTRTDTGQGLDFDIQDISIEVIAPNAPLSVDLLTSSDTGAANDDDLTRLSNLQFEVEGVTDGALVTIYDGNTAIGAATATGSSVVVPAVVGSANGVRNISATQTTGGVESDQSPVLAVTVDTDADGFTTTSPILSFNLGDTYTYNVGHNEELVGQQNLEYSLQTSPTGMSIDINTGQIIWEGDDQTAGTHDVVVVATDLAGNEGTQSFTLSVNGPPVLDLINDVTVGEGNDVSFTVSADDPNSGDMLTFSLDGDIPPASTDGESSTPSIDPTTGQFTWTPGELDGGTTFDFTVTVRDSGGLTDEQSFTVTVDEVNLAPSIESIDNETIVEENTLTINTVGADPDLPVQNLTYSLIGPPTGATIDGDTGQFTWTPTTEQANQNYTITVRVTDEGDLFDESSFVVTVQSTPEPPDFDEITVPTVGAGNVNEGDEIVVNLSATDPNLPFDTLNFAIISGPAGAIIDPGTGEWRWQTDETHGGNTFEVTVEVRDSTDRADTETFSVTVNEVNRNPSFDAQIGDQTVTEGDPLNLDFDASDPDLPAQSLIFSLIDPPDGATINSSTGEFNWVPTVDQALQEIDVKVRVSDGAGGSDEQTVTVTVEERAKAPVLEEISNRTVPEGDEVLVVPQATDPNEEENNLQFSLSQSPAGATIDPVSGEFRWQTDEADGPGDYDVTIVVTDSDGLTDEQSFVVTVQEVNQAPVLTAIADAEVMENRTLSFRASAGDLDDPTQTLRFSLGPGAPAGASIDLLTGDFAWTPAAGSTGSYDITIRVADDGSPLLSDSLSFSVEVVPATNPLAFAQTLALRSIQQQFIGPIAPPVDTSTSPVILPALVNQPASPNTSFDSAAETFRDYANIGSGSEGPADDGLGADRETVNRPVVPVVPSPDDQPDDGRRRSGLDEEEQEVEGDGAASAVDGDDGLSHHTVDEAIAALVAESGTGS